MKQHGHFIPSLPEFFKEGPTATGLVNFQRRAVLHEVEQVWPFVLQTVGMRNIPSV